MKKGYETNIISGRHNLTTRLESDRTPHEIAIEAIKKAGITEPAEVEVKELVGFGKWDGDVFDWKPTGTTATRDRLEEAIKAPKITREVMAEAMVRAARPEIGVEEVNGTNTGKRVNQYKAATNLNPKEEWPWCAAFVCWVVRQAARDCGLMWDGKLNRPTTAGAWAFEKWARAQDDRVETKKPAGKDILPGDIVVYNFSHIGIATGPPNSKGEFLVIEGNTNPAGSREGGGVFARKRNINQVRSRLRFMA